MSRAASKSRRPVLTPLESQGRQLGLYMTLPAQLLLLFIVAFPLVMQLYVSFTWWGPLDGTPWYMAYESANLFGNYGDLFDDSKLWGSIGRTFLIVGVCVPIEFLLGLGLAILFAEKFVGKRLFYSIMLMPMMIVPAVAGYMFFMLFQSRGPINDLLSRISGSEVEILWLADSSLAMVSVMIADIWQWTPLMFLILLAGMVGVPEDQMKAATLLGANAWQRFWRIVLPRMKMVMIIALVIRTIECIKIFDVLYVMTGGGAGDGDQVDLRLHPRPHLQESRMGLCGGGGPVHPDLPQRVRCDRPDPDAARPAPKRDHARVSALTAEPL